MKILYKDIAEATKKSESAIKSWKRNNPDLLRLTKLGVFCEKNNITLEDIKACIKMKELAKDSK